MKPKAAAIQMRSGIDVHKNLETAANLIAEASAMKAQLALLPEMFPLMGLNETDKLTIQEQEGIGLIQEFLSAQAKRHHLWLIGGTIPLTSTTPNKTKAASLVFNDKGQQVAHYDKIHLFDVTLNDNEAYQESATIEPGNHLANVDTPIGNIGLTVCYDLRFPELYRELFNRGAQIFTVPSAFTAHTGKAHWELLLRARAVENFCYVIGANQGGLHENGRETFGHSMIVDPWGSIVASIPGIEEGVVVADIDLDFLASVRKKIPVEKHQQFFIQSPK